MTVNNRKDARKEFAALTRTHLVGSGKPAQAVYSYLVSDFGGQSPVVVVSSSGTLREPFMFNNSKPSFRLRVFLFVLYGDKQNPAWNEEAAEDQLDDLEEALGDLIEKNQVNRYWSALVQSEFSERDDLDIGGNYYIRESLVVEVA